MMLIEGIGPDLPGQRFWKVASAIDRTARRWSWSRLELSKPPLKVRAFDARLRKRRLRDGSCLA